MAKYFYVINGIMKTGMNNTERSVLPDRSNASQDIAFFNYSQWPVIYELSTEKPKSGLPGNELAIADKPRNELKVCCHYLKDTSAELWQFEFVPESIL